MPPSRKYLNQGKADMMSNDQIAEYYAPKKPSTKRKPPSTKGKHPSTKRKHPAVKRAPVKKPATKKAGGKGSRSLSSNASPEAKRLWKFSKADLYADCKRLRVIGRSYMSKVQLVNALLRAKGKS